MGSAPTVGPAIALRPGFLDDRQQRLRDRVPALRVERQDAPVEVVRASPSGGEPELPERERAFGNRDVHDFLGL